MYYHIKNNIYFNISTFILFYSTYIAFFIISLKKKNESTDSPNNHSIENQSSTALVIDDECFQRYELFQRTYKSTLSDNIDLQKGLSFESLTMLYNSFVNQYFNIYSDEFSFKELIVDCVISKKSLITLLKHVPRRFTLKITENCKSFILIDSKIYTIKLELFHVFTNSHRLLVNETCRTINYGACYQCNNLKVLAFPNSVTKIQNYAFKDCMNLKRVTFKNGSKLNWIGDRAFKNTGLKIIRLPMSLNSIGFEAFRCCKNLHKVIFPDGIKMQKLCT